MVMIMSGLTTLFSWASSTNFVHVVIDNKWKKENDCYSSNSFMINFHESMGQGGDQTLDPWICRPRLQSPPLSIVLIVQEKFLKIK